MKNCKHCGKAISLDSIDAYCKDCRKLKIDTTHILIDIFEDILKDIASHPYASRTYPTCEGNFALAVHNVVSKIVTSTFKEHEARIKNLSKKCDSLEEHTKSIPNKLGKVEKVQKYHGHILVNGGCCAWCDCCKLDKGVHLCTKHDTVIENIWTEYCDCYADVLTEKKLPKAKE